MAIYSLRRLSSQISRNPTLSLYSRAIISRSSATTSSSAKVSDRIVKLMAYDFDGQKHKVVSLSGQTLLKALINHNLIDPTGVKKHFSRKHGEKKWNCETCSKKYTVQSDLKAHSKICGSTCLLLASAQLGSAFGSKSGQDPKSMFCIWMELSSHLSIVVRNNIPGISSGSSYAQPFTSSQPGEFDWLLC